jgi:hypothetical protein
MNGTRHPVPGTTSRSIGFNPELGTKLDAMAMVNCERFLDDYSTFRDGELPARERVAFQAHLDECAACAHYDRVVAGGVEILRDLPRLEVSEDFGARLQHRIWHEELDRMRGRRRARTVGMTGAMGLAAALAGVAIGLSLRTERALTPADPLALENDGVGGYVVDGAHPEAGSVSSQLARLGVHVYELPYHDVVYRRDATLVASLAEYAGDPNVVPVR